MLQQTTVAAVIPYFGRFCTAWPTVTALAEAPLDDVLKAWAGLGYYARARNLHKCAQKVAFDCGGTFPKDEDVLLRLPGIGAYTAAAITSIAFDRPAVVVDGNVERVMARLFAVEAPLPECKPMLRRHAADLSPDSRPGDYAQAVMDLGATVCTPRNPKCLTCPLSDDCAARKAGSADRLPLRVPKRPRPVRHGVCFWIQRRDGAVLLRRRPEKGLLGGMAEVPGTAWRPTPWLSEAEIAAAAPPVPAWRPLSQSARHVFTHFTLELTVWTAIVDDQWSAWDGFWCLADDLDGQALPSVMRKVVALGLAGAES